MKKILLPLSIALIAPLFFLSACDSDDASDLSSKSAREIAQAQASAAKCSVSLMSGACSTDGLSIASVKCNGVDLTIASADLACPMGTKCVVLDEGIGLMPYCVPADETPECVISICDAEDSAKIKKCVNSKFSVESCAADEVCRVGGKSDAGKDLAASCVKKPSTDPKEAEDNYDPCKTSGHTATVGDACSADDKIALYTCEDGFIMAENCYPYDCQNVNPKQTIASWADDTNDFAIKAVITTMAAVMPDKDVHGCNIKAALDLMKSVLIIDMDIDFPEIPEI